MTRKEKSDIKRKLSLINYAEKIGNEAIIPTNNDLFAESVLKYPAGWALDPYFSASIRTQVTESFKIYKDKIKRTAKYWDPVISQQALGFAYRMKNKTDKFSGRLGCSLKQTRADKHTTLSDDKKTTGSIEKYKPESGIELKLETNYLIDLSIIYKSSAEFFGTFKEIEKWTIRWENEIHLKIWKIFGVLFNLDYYFGEKQSIYAQYKQSFRLGMIAVL